MVDRMHLRNWVRPLRRRKQPGLEWGARRNESVWRVLDSISGMIQSSPKDLKSRSNEMSAGGVVGEGERWMVFTFPAI